MSIYITEKVVLPKIDIIPSGRMNLNNNIYMKSEVDYHYKRYIWQLFMYAGYKNIINQVLVMYDTDDRLVNINYLVEILFVSEKETKSQKVALDIGYYPTGKMNYEHYYCIPNVLNRLIAVSNYKEKYTLSETNSGTKIGTKKGTKNNIKSEIREDNDNPNYVQYYEDGTKKIETYSLGGELHRRSRLPTCIITHKSGMITRKYYKHGKFIKSNIVM
jgi:hypothetical protein